MAKIPMDEQGRQELYRDARFKNQYDDIWQSVNKCVFCDLNEKYVFFEENGIVMTVSLYAYIDGHFMIVPRRHIRSTKELSQLEWDTIRKFSYIAKKMVRDVHGIKGLQLVLRDGGIVAQSTVSDHLHIHCVPFDAPDLNLWNYRKLKYTPLENVALYKQKSHKIINQSVKFDQKYQNHAALPVVCDLIAINKNYEVLIQERSMGSKLHPDYLTIVGGHVVDFNVPLEQELAREIQEETGWKIDKNKVELLKSQIGRISHEKISVHLKARYAQPSTFIWNTYVIRDVDNDIALKPDSDSKSLVWIPIKEAILHPRLTMEVKALVQFAIDKYKLTEQSKS